MCLCKQREPSGKGLSSDQVNSSITNICVETSCNCMICFYARVKYSILQINDTNFVKPSADVVKGHLVILDQVAC